MNDFKFTGAGYPYLVGVNLVHIGTFLRFLVANEKLCRVRIERLHTGKENMCAEGPDGLLRGDKANELWAKTGSRYLTHARKKTAVVSNITHGNFLRDVSIYSVTLLLFSLFSCCCPLLKRI
jgi:hypothetical protein